MVFQQLFSSFASALRNSLSTGKKRRRMEEVEDEEEHSTRTTAKLRAVSAPHPQHGTNSNHLAHAPPPALSPSPQTAGLREMVQSLKLTHDIRPFGSPQHLPIHPPQRDQQQRPSLAELDRMQPSLPAPPAAAVPLSSYHPSQPHRPGQAPMLGSQASKPPQVVPKRLHAYFNDAAHARAQRSALHPPHPWSISTPAPPNSSSIARPQPSSRGVRGFFWGGAHAMDWHGVQPRLSACLLGVVIGDTSTHCIT